MNSDSFITRWGQSGVAERANYQLFLSELCDMLGVERPQPTDPDERANAYVFEKAVPSTRGTMGRINLYKCGCFVGLIDYWGTLPRSRIDLIIQTILRTMRVL